MCTSLNIVLTNLAKCKVKNNEGVSAWKRNNTLNMGDSEIFGLKESKVSRRWAIKIRSFPGEKIKDMLIR